MHDDPDAKPIHDEEWEAKMHEIEQKASKLRTPRMPDVPEWNYQRSASSKRPEHQDKGNYKGLGVGISLAYTLVGSMILGWAIGWLIDRRSGGTTAQALGALAGAILGTVASIILTNRFSDRR